MDENKILDFMKKIYIELQSHGKKLDNLDSRLTNVEDRLTNVEKTVAKIEIEHGEKLSALFDGYKQTNDRLDRMESKIDAMSLKLESHDVKIQVIESKRLRRVK